MSSQTIWPKSIYKYPVQNVQITFMFVNRNLQQGCCTSRSQHYIYWLKLLLMSNKTVFSDFKGETVIKFN